MLTAWASGRSNLPFATRRDDAVGLLRREILGQVERWMPVALFPFGLLEKTLGSLEKTLSTLENSKVLSVFSMAPTVHAGFRLLF